MLNNLLSDSRKILKLYGLGALLFFVGMAFIQWGANMLAPSLQQEIIVLAGMIIGGLGFIIAMLSQCLLIAQRFKNMGNNSNKK